MRTVLANVDGWTPIIDDLVRQLGLGPAATFGVMWRYCQMRDGVCYASFQTIADHLGINRSTVIEHIKVLEKGGFIEDTTPGIRNAPHTYRDTGRAGMRFGITAGVGKSDTSGPKMPVGVGKSDTQESDFPSPGVGKSDPKKDIKKEDEERGGLSTDAQQKHWRMVKFQLNQEMKLHLYREWVEPITLAQVVDAEYTLRAQSAEAAAIFADRFTSTISRMLTGLEGRPCTVKVIA